MSERREFIVEALLWVEALDADDAERKGRDALDRALSRARRVSAYTVVDVRVSGDADDLEAQA